MPFKKPVVALLGLMLVTAAVPSPATAQEEPPGPVFLEVHCMKSTSADYAEVETEIWRPMHQEMVKQGKKAGWSLYWVLYGDRSECDYYTVDSYRGLDQLNTDRAYADHFATVHPGKSWDEAEARTSASRTMVRSELWQWIDGVPPTGYQFAVANQMRADDVAAAVAFEREIWKPVHEALVASETTAGWGLYWLVSPQGTAVSYNYGTVDFLDRLGPFPIDAAMSSAHPETDPGALWDKGQELRDHLRAETWVLVTATE